MSTRFRWRQRGLAFVTAASLISGSVATIATSIAAPTRVSAAGPIDGSTANCGNFEVTILGLIGVADISEPGWVLVNPAQQFKDVVGTVTKSKVTHTDFPTVHDSHDQNTVLDVDPAYEGIVSDANEDGEMELEWEIGTFPSETGSDPERTFPKWAWPNVGDRVWANGSWIFDCGHPEDIGGTDHFKTEIHPPRAFASMRQIVRTLPGTGATPVPVTQTNVWIHGRAGFVGDDLACGQQIIINDGTCSPIAYPHRGFPIDTDYEFDVASPPKPFPSAVLATFVEDAPGNTLNVAPILTPSADGSSVHVKVPLAGSGATPDDKYARRIYSGWVYPPNDLKHLKLTLNKMDLHDDMDTDPGDCECTFFWMSVDGAADSWIRLSTFATGNMNDYDDDDGFGDGEMGFSGADFDFYVANGKPYTVRANGYDQDCLDDEFGEHGIGNVVGGVVVPNSNAFELLDCYIGTGALTLEAGDNDDYNQLKATFGPSGYGVGNQDVTAGGQYELEFGVQNIALTVEDSADLALDKICKPDNIANAGSTVTCTILVDNPGPGLPRNVVVRDTLLTDVLPGTYTLGTPTFVFEGFGGAPNPCTVTPPNQFTCALGTVPINGRAIITATFSSLEGGDFNNQARVSTDSTDPNLSNNADVDGLTVRPIADLAVTKSGPDTGVAGTDLTYLLEVTNNGPSTATNVLLSDVLPLGTSILSVSGTGGASCNAGQPGNALLPTTCTFDSMAPTTTKSMTILSHVAPDVVGTIHNDVRATSDTLDLNNANNLATKATVISAVADLVVTKSAAPTPSVVAGEGLTYTVAVRNDGPSVARAVQLRDTLPASVQLLSWSTSGGGTCQLLAPPPNLVDCSLGTLSPGTTTFVYLTTKVAASVLDGSTLTNSATATTSAADPTPGNSTGTVNTGVVARADLRVVKTSDKDVYKSSSQVKYTITVTNLGSSDAQDTTITDLLPDTKQAIYNFDSGGCSKAGLTLTCPVGLLPAGGSYSINVYVTIKGSKGQVLNVGRVSSSTIDPVTANNESTRIVLIGK